MPKYADVVECVFDVQQARQDNTPVYAQLRKRQVEAELMLSGCGRAAIADLFDRAELENAITQNDLKKLEEISNGSW